MWYGWNRDPILTRSSKEAWAFASGHDVDACWGDSVKTSHEESSEDEAKDE